VHRCVIILIDLNNKREGFQGVAQEAQASWANIWGTFCYLWGFNWYSWEAKGSLLLISFSKGVYSISNIRVIYDILDESLFATIAVMATNPSCSTTPSSTSDGLTCDSTLIIENETVKKEVNELN
jgi:hypothetical protein